MEQLLASLIVAIITSIFTYLFTKKLQHDQNRRTETVQEKLQHTLWTLDLWKEHESRDMIKLRREASDVVNYCFTREPPISYEVLRESKDIQDQERFNKIHHLVHFYELVAIQFDLGLLNNELFMRKLARPFLFYFERVISPFIDDSRANGKNDHHWMEPLENLYYRLNKYPTIYNHPKFQ